MQWDTAGQERFKTITSSYYKGAHGIIVTYDVTDKDSFRAIDNWMSEVEKHASDNVSRILVGNKCDLEESRQVTTDEGKELADHYNIRFLETSAKESSNVEDAFTLMTKEIKSRVVQTDVKKPVGKIIWAYARSTRRPHSKPWHAPDEENRRKEGWRVRIVI